jgi:hypothetical protein
LSVSGLFSQCDVVHPPRYSHVITRVTHLQRSTRTKVTHILKESREQTRKPTHGFQGENKYPAAIRLVNHKDRQTISLTMIYKAPHFAVMGGCHHLGYVLEAENELSMPPTCKIAFHRSRDSCTDIRVAPVMAFAISILLIPSRLRQPRQPSVASTQATPTVRRVYSSHANRPSRLPKPRQPSVASTQATPTVRRVYPSHANRPSRLSLKLSSIYAAVDFLSRPVLDADRCPGFPSCPGRD